ncbi:hypothetical protein TIFTF001_020531 [Ficus carica]|uniref:Uncharacterized protein n=1 Tax=Ficus carica TaxID=3494 RepID=A0AA88AIM5_FICCA|nr:hypothetical protein TIFTF001_020531 [Ficus carica]
MDSKLSKTWDPIPLHSKSNLIYCAANPRTVCPWFPCCPSAVHPPPRLPLPSSGPRRDCDTRKRTELGNRTNSGVLGELGLVDSGDLENGAAAQHLGHSDLDREWVLLGVCYGTAPLRKSAFTDRSASIGSKRDKKFEAGLKLSGDERVDRGGATVGAEQREQVGRGALGIVSGGGGEERESSLRESGDSGGFSRSGDGEIGVENLVEESGVGEARWVAEGERGGRGFDEVRVEVLGLVTNFEDEVLEGVCGKWVRQEVGGEEG